MILPIHYPPPSHAASLAFLVVDDSTVMRRVVSNHLKDMGVQIIHQAGDAQTAWHVLTSNTIHCILCDWNMPGMTGIELLMQVRGDSRYCSLPFLMVSAEAQPEFILEAIGKGVTNYLTKPFTGPALQRKVAAALQHRFNWPTSSAAQSETGAASVSQ